MLAALLRMLVEAPEEVPPRVPGLLADLAARHPPLQRRAMDGGALESLADLVQLPEPESCAELLVRGLWGEAASNQRTMRSACWFSQPAAWRQSARLNVDTHARCDAVVQCSQRGAKPASRELFVERHPAGSPTKAHSGILSFAIQTCQKQMHHILACERLATRSRPPD